MEVPALTWVIVLIGPVVALGAALVASVKSDLKDLQENWVKYRCYPIYMPFSSWIKPDVTVEENFTYCLNMFGQAVMDRALDPVYSLFDVITSILGDLMNSTNIFRTIFAKITNVVLTVVGSVFGKIFNAMGALLHSLGRVRDISSRITGSTWYLAFIAQSAVDMIMSVTNFAYTLVKIVVTLMFAISVILSLFYPPLLAFAITLGAGVGITYCFDPDTRIELATGNVVPLRQIQIGDVLLGGSVVEGVLQFRNHSKVEMFMLDGIRVSGHHKIYTKDGCIYVKDHPRSIPITYLLPDLLCLITHDNKVSIRGHSGTQHLFTDYEEDLDEHVMEEIEQLTWGRVVHAPGLPGFCENTLVPLFNGDKVCISNLSIGDILACGAVVDGVVRHSGKLQGWIVVDDIGMTESQPVLHDLEMPSVLLARDHPVAVPRSLHTGDAYSIVLRNSFGWFVVESPFGTQYVVRDYLESHNESVLEHIEEIVMKSLNGKNAQ
jgi:hypothetical protein